MIANLKLRPKGGMKSGSLKKVPGSSPRRDLTAENRALRKAVKSLEKERDFFRDAVYAWAKKNMTRKEMEALVRDYRNGAPLQDFIDDLEKEVLEAS